MISKNVSIIDLDPYTWRNLGEIMDIVIPKRNTIHILHDEGKLINAIQSGKGLINDIVFDFNNIKVSVDNLLLKNEDVEEVYVFNLNSLIEYYATIQASSFPDMDNDEYISFTLGLLQNYKGIDVYKRNQDNKDIYQKIREYVYGNLPETCTIVLGIFDNGKLYFNAIFGIEKHKINLITTFDHLEAEGFKQEVTIEDCKAVEKAVQEKLKAPVKLFFMEKAEFIELFKII